MVFKLLRTDTSDPRKIALPTGTHLFGRGTFFDCDDKKISRNHGKLDVKDDTVTLTSLHRNPCFYIKKYSSEKEIIRQNSSILLNNGDRFSLLPHSYEYELLHIASQDVQIQSTVSIETSELSTEGGSNAAPSAADVSTEVVNSNDLLDLQLNKTMSAVSELNGSQAFLAPPNALSSDTDPTAPQVTDGPNNQPITSSQDTVITDNCQSTDSLSQDTLPGDQSPAKRSHSEDNDGVVVKRVKAEPVDSAVGDGIIHPGPSNAGLAGATVKAEPPSPDKAAAPAPPRRERCKYGASCYRMNPAHKAQFSHPADPDWGTGERVPCPYGAACTKRQPWHLRDHDHPPGTHQPPPQPRPGDQVVVRHGRVFYINARSVNLHDDHEVEDPDGASFNSDGDSVDSDRDSDESDRDSDDSDRDSFDSHEESFDSDEDSFDSDRDSDDSDGDSADFHYDF